VEEVAKRYAHAFFEGNEQIAAKLEDELGQIWAQITSRHDLEQILIHPEVDMSAKKSVINDLTGNAMPQTRRIMDLLLDHKRIDTLGDILMIFRRLRLAALGEIEVHVESVLEVDPAVKDHIEQLITKLTGLKPVITEKVNPDLLGGIRLGFGDVLLDGSARKSLAECVEIIRGRKGK
jgi:F-type H+-transporting ATPase subunit delta